MYSEEKLQKMKDRAYQNKLRSYKRHLIRQREKRNKFFRVNDNLQLIEISNRIGSLRNCLRWYVGESKEHIMKKLELCMDLKENKYEFICEAKFKTGGRCDILDLSNGTIYEILHSETEQQFEANKNLCYPAGFALVRVEC